MKTYSIPGIDFPVSSVILGLMRISAMDAAAIRTLVDTAREAGINFLDHADVYGEGPHGAERQFGEAIRFTPAERERFAEKVKPVVEKFSAQVGKDFSDMYFSELKKIQSGAN